MNTIQLHASNHAHFSPWFLKNYLITSVIKEDEKGGVFIAQDYNKDWFGKNEVIVKQGKGNTKPDEFGRTIRDNFKWQLYLNESLHKLLDLPKITELIKYKHNFYLIMEYIKGVTLREKLRMIFEYRTWNMLSTQQQNSIVKMLLEILHMVGLMHEAGFVHRDLTLDNFIVDKSDDVYMIDFELAYALGEDPPPPPYAWGTFGYMSPEQRSQFIPTIKEDIFGLGALLLSAFTNLPALKFDIDYPYLLNIPLQLYGVPTHISLLIQQCLNEEKDMRPDLIEIRETLNELYCEKE